MRRALALALLLAACQQERLHEQASREAAMRNVLSAMRKAIADFRADKGRGPYSLEELQTEKYLRNIPKDPLTNAADWRVTTEAAVRNDDFTSSAAATEPQVIEVHSRAPGRDASGKLYSDY